MGLVNNTQRFKLKEIIVIFPKEKFMSQDVEKEMFWIFKIKAKENMSLSNLSQLHYPCFQSALFSFLTE